MSVQHGKQTKKPRTRTVVLAQFADEMIFDVLLFISCLTVFLKLLVVFVKADFSERQVSRAYSVSLLVPSIAMPGRYRQVVVEVIGTGV